MIPEPGDWVYWVRPGRPRILAVVVTLDGSGNARLNPLLRAMTAGAEPIVPLAELVARSPDAPPVARTTILLPEDQC